MRHITPVSHGLRLRSIPGVFAAGDCTAIPFKQIVVAQGAGATAGLSAWDHLIRTQAVVPASLPRKAAGPVAVMATGPSACCGSIEP